MRASRWPLRAALLVWLLAVLVHAALTASMPLRLSLSGVGRVLDATEGSGATCRVLVLGSSPAVLGLSAAQIEAATGCTAANAGLIALSSGMDRYFEAVLERVRPGDTVVMTDRRWMEADGDPDPDDRSVLLDFLAAIEPIPDLNNDLRALGPWRLPRDQRGDLTRFPGYAGRAIYFEPRDRADDDATLQLLERQVAKIRARGAMPLLAAAPLLVRPDDPDGSRARTAALSNDVARRLGANIWLGPELLTDLSLFTLDGRHSSAEGRQRWTSAVIEKVLAQRGVDRSPTRRDSSP